MTINNNNINNVNLNVKDNLLKNKKKVEKNEANQKANQKDTAEIKVNAKNNVPIVTILDKNENKTIEKYSKEIFKILDEKNNLELTDKDKIIDLFKDAEKNGNFNELVEHLDKNNKLIDVYKSLGTLVNQGEGGAVTSAVLAIFTLGLSTISEGKMNKAFELKNMMEKNNVSKEIIDKLK